MNDNTNINLIDNDLIKTYSLENEEFECPVCEKLIKSIDFNNHYKSCYLNYITKIQEEVNEKNKNIEMENNNNYYKSIFEYCFEKLDNIDFNKIIMNYKLDFINIDFKNCAFILNNNLKNLNKDYTNIILTSENNNLNSKNKVFLLNNNKKYNYNDYKNDILFINSSNLFKKDINNLLNNIDNNNISYFSDVNVLTFISELLNINIDSYLNFLFYLIKILDEKIDVYINKNELIQEELIYLEHLERLEYINIVYHNESEK